MKKWFLIAVGVLLALTTGNVPQAYAQGVSVQIGPGGVEVGNPYRDGRRRDYYESRQYRGRGHARGERRGSRVIIVKPRRDRHRY